MVLTAFKVHHLVRGIKPRSRPLTVGPNPMALIKAPTSERGAPLPERCGQHLVNARNGSYNPLALLSYEGGRG